MSSPSNIVSDMFLTEANGERNDAAMFMAETTGPISEEQIGAETEQDRNRNVGCGTSNDAKSF